MLIQQDIVNFCNQYDYDVRKTNNARWIDQKCTADVLSVIADFILNYVAEKPNSVFTTPDIWHSQYAIENVEDIFKKPGVESIDAKNEYDKFFQQPMELLAYSQVLLKTKQGNRNFYQVQNLQMLEYISMRERNSLFFLKTYIEKVLTDCGLMPLFVDFFNEQTKNTFRDMKNGFSSFTIANTKINKELECNRIFTKVINPLAYFHNSYGTEGGHLSSQIITYDMLMYNRNNFRDVYADKPKGITRKEYATTHPVVVNNAYYKYQSVKAKKFLRLFNEQYRNGSTEVWEERHIQDKTTNIHHIFPEAEYPEISYYLENLIALTPTQHYNYAHPNAYTQEINEQYQHILLLAKADRIQENLTDTGVEIIYEFCRFLFVLNVGFDNDELMAINDMDFASVVNAINIHYAA